MEGGGVKCWRNQFDGTPVDKVGLSCDVMAIHYFRAQSVQYVSTAYNHDVQINDKRTRREIADRPTPDLSGLTLAPVAAERDRTLADDANRDKQR